MKYFFPSAYVNKVTDINQNLLQKYRTKAILLDIDNTLVPHNSKELFDGVLEWISNMKTLNLKLLILSNRSNIESVNEFASKLSLEYVANAQKPLQTGFNNAIKKLKLPKETILLVGDQIFTDILGANIAGIKSVLVEPLDKNESIFIKIKRFFEKPFRAIIKRNIKKEQI